MIPTDNRAYTKNQSQSIACLSVIRCKQPVLKIYVSYAFSIVFLPLWRINCKQFCDSEVRVYCEPWRKKYWPYPFWIWKFRSLFTINLVLSFWWEWEKFQYFVKMRRSFIKPRIGKVYLYNWSSFHQWICRVVCGSAEKWPRKCFRRTSKIMILITLRLNQLWVVYCW